MAWSTHSSALWAPTLICPLDMGPQSLVLILFSFTILAFFAVSRWPHSLSGLLHFHMWMISHLCIQLRLLFSSKHAHSVAYWTSLLATGSSGTSVHHTFSSLDPGQTLFAFQPQLFPVSGKAVTITYLLTLGGVWSPVLLNNINDNNSSACYS